MLGNNLKYCRESLELTQKELGSVFKVAESTVSGWENCHDIIPLTKLALFSDLYNFSMDYVMGLSKKNILYTKINKINKEDICKNLKQIRKKLNMTQKELADECSIAQTTYSNYEIGTSLITTLTLYTICKNHNISMDLVLNRKPI